MGPPRLQTVNQGLVDSRKQGWTSREKAPDRKPSTAEQGGSAPRFAPLPVAHRSRAAENAALAPVNHPQGAQNAPHGLNRAASRSAHCREVQSRLQKRGRGRTGRRRSPEGTPGIRPTQPNATVRVQASAEADQHKPRHSPAGRDYPKHPGD